MWHCRPRCGPRAKPWFWHQGLDSTGVASARDGEGFAVPVEGHERIAARAEPRLRHGARRATWTCPQPISLTGARDTVPPERLGDELPAQAMPEHRHISCDRLADQIEHPRNPGQLVVDAHGAAHEHEPAELVYARRHRLAGVHLDQLPRHPGAVQEGGEVSGALGRAVAEDGDWFHRRDATHMTGKRRECKSVLLALLLMLQATAAGAQDERDQRRRAVAGQGRGDRGRQSAPARPARRRQPAQRGAAHQGHARIGRVRDRRRAPHHDDGQPGVRRYTQLPAAAR